MEKLGWSRQMSEGTLMSVLNKFKAMIEGGGVSSTPQITIFFPRVEHKLKVVNSFNFCNYVAGFLSYLFFNFRVILDLHKQLIS